MAEVTHKHGLRHSHSPPNTSFYARKNSLLGALEFSRVNTINSRQNRAPILHGQSPPDIRQNGTDAEYGSIISIGDNTGAVRGSPEECAYIHGPGVPGVQAHSSNIGQDLMLNNCTDSESNHPTIRLRGASGQNSAYDTDAESEFDGVTRKRETSHSRHVYTRAYAHMGASAEGRDPLQESAPISSFAPFTHNFSTAMPSNRNKQSTTHTGPHQQNIGTYYTRRLRHSEMRTNNSMIKPAFIGTDPRQDHNNTNNNHNNHSNRSRRSYMQKDYHTGSSHKADTVQTCPLAVSGRYTSGHFSPEGSTYTHDNHLHDTQMPNRVSHETEKRRLDDAFTSFYNHDFDLDHNHDGCDTPVPLSDHTHACVTCTDNDSVSAPSYAHITSLHGNHADVCSDPGSWASPNYVGHIELSYSIDSVTGHDAANQRTGSVFGTRNLDTQTQTPASAGAIQRSATEFGTYSSANQTQNLTEYNTVDNQYEARTNNADESESGTFECQNHNISHTNNVDESESVSYEFQKCSSSHTNIANQAVSMLYGNSHAAARAHAHTGNGHKNSDKHTNNRQSVASLFGYFDVAEISSLHADPKNMERKGGAYVHNSSKSTNIKYTSDTSKKILQEDFYDFYDVPDNNSRVTSKYASVTNKRLLQEDIGDFSGNNNKGTSQYASVTSKRLPNGRALSDVTHRNVGINTSINNKNNSSASYSELPTVTSKSGRVIVSPVGRKARLYGNKEDTVLQGASIPVHETLFDPLHGDLEPW
jgi:hypothetical protein